MELVDKHDNVTLLLDLIHHLLQPVFKLTTILGAGYHCCHVEHNHSSVEQMVGHFFVHNALRETLDDSSFTNSRFTNQHWVVLSTATKNCHKALNFPCPTNHCVELASSSLTRQINAIRAERAATNSLLLWFSGDITVLSTRPIKIVL